jgi:hypothetical protein
MPSRESTVSGWSLETQHEIDGGLPWCFACEIEAFEVFKDND